jgi:hypothetical protein
MAQLLHIHIKLLLISIFSSTLFCGVVDRDRYKIIYPDNPPKTSIWVGNEFLNILINELDKIEFQNRVTFEIDDINDSNFLAFADFETKKIVINPNIENIKNFKSTIRTTILHELSHLKQFDYIEKLKNQDKWLFEGISVYESNENTDRLIYNIKEHSNMGLFNSDAPFVYFGYFIIKDLINNYNSSVNQILNIYKSSQNSFFVIEEITKQKIDNYIISFWNRNIDLVSSNLDQVDFAGAIIPKKDYIIFDNNLSEIEINNTKSIYNILNKDNLYIFNNRHILTYDTIYNRVDLNIKNGWNMFGLAFSIDSIAWQYNNSYIKDNKTLPFFGFWLYSNRNETLTFQENIENKNRYYPIKNNVGWNFLSNPLGKKIKLEEKVYTFIDNEWQQSNIIPSYNGFWINR